ncbi:MAG: heme-binding protein [Planctomycetaceae bacterium]|nr:heme-binding protein [Planctomycetaceae bacterium]
MLRILFVLGLISVLPSARLCAQGLEQRLQSEPAADLVRDARELGDAKRGAVVFYQPMLACTRCHIADKEDNRLGPDLTKLDKTATDAHIVESVLHPSKVVSKGFETIAIMTLDGRTLSGTLVSDTKAALTIRSLEQNFKEVRFKKSEIDEYVQSKLSIMPAGLTNLLTSRQQFLDLVRYLIEIRDGGAARARELEPPPSLYAARPLPEYEQKVDHAGFLGDLDSAAFKRGEAIYNRLCINCHGTHDKPGSLPTSLKFASGKFKNGHDPFTMYQTLTRGFGMMVAQTWMVPSQKYDVIHYIREAYLKQHNPSQYFPIKREYVASLPKGDTRGPEPSNILEWEQMDYGPNLVMTLEVGEDAKNFAYKGNAVRLDAGPGGVSQGRYWMAFDYDTLRGAAAWSGKGFIDYNGINFNGRHNIHPRVVGDVQLANPTGPGWGRPEDGSFEDVRLVGRDDRIYGPLPRDWAQYKGMYYHGPRTIVRYTVGKTEVLEMPGMLAETAQPVFTRTFNVGPRATDLLLQVAHRDEPGAGLLVHPAMVPGDGRPGSAKPTFVQFGPAGGDESRQPDRVADASSFNGGTRVEVSQAEKINLQESDFTITARIRTKQDGSIFARTTNGPRWVPNGMAWFIRGGRLTFDIGWVGAYTGARRVSDGKWHDVAVTYERSSGAVQFFVDGKPDRKKPGTLKPKGPVDKPVVRIGFAAANFPSKPFFDGRISEVRYYNTVLESEQLQADAEIGGNALIARWDLSASKNSVVRDATGREQDGTVIVGKAASGSNRASGWTVAGTEGDDERFEWFAEEGNLRLRIPAGTEPRKFTLWFGTAAKRDEMAVLAESVVLDEPGQDLGRYTQGGPSRWPQVLESVAILGEDAGPFAVDVLKRPTDNPWFCRMRLTGFDFTPDGKAAIVSAWDGSIWLVDGLDGLPQQTPDGERSVKITWRRIASGLFQPLGVKVLEGKVYVTCRDQICILHDLNGDDEIDYFESFNNDHQVTDHFHEFAMGLQSDEEGNLYYAKSARHALTALVPHHGTLLRVSKDGLRTDIVANGFRAANGVCLNPDGTFIVTDQEGHWNPKNRINYVSEGGFYGNMFGYHNVTNSADEAMEQPLCWITNAFDRSPAELLWVDSERWGPLNKRLLNLSYGYGKVYVVPHEKIDGQPQGGMCEFPIPRFPTGVMRGRFHPQDGQLYLAGMFAWAGSQQQPGGLYRIRYTGKPVHLPVELKATRKGMTLVFSGELDVKSASDAGNYRVKVWDLKRTASYGSKHYNEHSLEVTSANVDADGKTVRLTIPEIAPTWGMEIRYRFKSANGETIDGTVHNTIHELGE